MLMKLRETVCLENIKLATLGLAPLTWGNVSGIDRDAGIVAIKPSGVPYSELTPERIVLVSLDGTIISKNFRPSTDLDTHLHLYRTYPEVGGVAHAHSPYSTTFAQGCLDIPVLGTTHADCFPGPVRCTRLLTKAETEKAYGLSTGIAITDLIGDGDALAIRAALLPFHGPFTWARNAPDAVKVALELEEVARLAFMTLSISPCAPEFPEHLKDCHYARKYGTGATYGQVKG